MAHALNFIFRHWNASAGDIVGADFVRCQGSIVPQDLPGTIILPSVTNKLILYRKLTRPLCNIYGFYTYFYDGVSQ